MIVRAILISTTLRIARPLAAMLILVIALSAACGSRGPAGESVRSPMVPVVVATTNILGDVLENLVDGQFDVVTVMPAGSDPHSFQPSAQDVATINNASAIIANGASFEGGLLVYVEAAQANGTPVFDAITAVNPIESTKDHGYEDHGAHGLDPHFFTDPARMAAAADAIVEFLIARVDTIDAAELRASAERYVSELRSLDREVEAMLAVVPEWRRVMVTNHEVFGYFADRYDFEVIGTVVPAGSAMEGVSGRRLAELAALLRREGVLVVFAETSSSDELAQTLASEVGDVTVTTLYAESLGNEHSDGATYIEMVRSNARQISDALAN